MPVIDCSDLQKSFGENTILSSVTLTIRNGEHVGLVGNNGCGKSTLGRILSGLEGTDEGKIAKRRGARIDYLAQEPALPAGQSIRDVVLASLEEWNEAKARHDALTARLAESPADTEALVAEQAAAGEVLEHLGGWERLHEAEAIISHLDIADSSRKVDALSGGERRRVALARILVGAPDLAILDEPTNHLDVDTIEWLEEYLANRFKGALLLITHDRYVLDRVTSRTLELDQGIVTSYKGGYVEYLEARAERQSLAERTERNRQNFLRSELEWLRRQPKARGTKQKARIGRAEAAMEQQAPRREQEVDLRAQSERLGRTMLEVVGLKLERQGRTLIDGLDLALSQGERIGIVGPNGSGKTSLLLCLLSQLECSSGRIDLGQNTRIGYLDQTRVDLDPEKTIREEVAGDQDTIEVAGEELRVESYLERFLFGREAWRTELGVLSGGERARVCLAKLLAQKTNLLLLDEPTNDLDVSALAALEDMLCGYGGSALIVSHDRWFMDRVATSILAFEEGGKLDLHRGNYSEYREKRRAEERARAAAQPKRVETPTAETARQARPKKLSFAESRELEGLLDEIERAEELAAEIEAKLADPATYAQEGAAIAELSRSLDEAGQRVETLTARWEELEAKRAAAL